MISSRYQVLQEIGAGGIGRVFKAVDRYRGHAVAVKVLSLLQPEHIDRFKREFLLLRRLNHPHIVGVYDFGIARQGQPYFSMEYLEGRDWNSFLKPLDQPEFWFVISRICSTLDFLHSKGIIHGDLKPSNIFICPSTEGQLVPRFTDFGFAELGQPDESSWWKGTPSYLAPEIIRGERYTHQADLYSLGVLIYESIFGKRPFEEKELIELAKSHLEKEVVIPEEPSVPENLRNLILGLLEKDPMDRYFSAAEVIDELRKIAPLDTHDTNSSLARQLIASADFAGREKQLSVLREAWGKNLGGANMVMLLSGESGVGKTRLLQEFSAQVELEGASVLSLPLAQGKTLETHQEEISLLLQGDSSSRLLIVENLEHADDASVAFLGRMAHQAEGKSLLVCLSITNDLTRSDKDKRASHVQKLIESTFRDRLELLSLSEMIEEEAKGLTSSLFTWKEKEAEREAAVYRKTRGNPLLVKQLFEWLADNQSICRQDGGWKVELEQIRVAQVPPSLAADITDRLSRLSAKELDLLRMASVLGLEFETEALGELYGTDPPAFRKQIKNIVAESVLVPSDTHSNSRPLRFLNGFTRDFVYAQIPTAEVKTLHLKVARHLEQRRSSGTGNHLDQLADHYYRAGRSESALRYALLVAQNAGESGEAGRAIMHYLRALELWDQWPSPPTTQKAEVLRDLAEQYEADGRFQDSIDSFQAALDLTRQENPEHPDLVRISRNLAHIYGKTSQHERATKVLNQALQLVNPEKRPSEYASVLIDLAWQSKIACDYHGAAQHLEKAVRALEGTPKSKELGIGLNYLAGVYWGLGDCAKALQSLSGSLDVFQELGDMQETAGCYIARALLLRSEGLPGEALEESQKALALLEKLSDPYRMSVLQHNLGIIHTDLNHWDRALECFRRNLELKMRLSDLSGVALSYNAIGHIYLRKGHFRRSHDQLVSALQLFQEIRDRSGAALVYYNLADLHRHKQEYEKAGHYLKKSLKMAGEIGEESRTADCMLLQGRIHLEQSELPQASKTLTQAQQLFAKGKNRLGEAETQLALAELSLQNQDLIEAEEHLEKVQQFVRSSGNKWLEAFSDEICAKLLQARGDQNGCLKRLSHSAATFKSFGARCELGRVYLELGKLKLENGRTIEGKAFLSEALSLFEKSEVEGRTKEATTLLAQIKQMPQLEKERTRTFYKLADILNSVWDTDELLAKALELVIELLNAERGAIILFSEGDKGFEIKVSRGLEPETSKDAIAISRRVLTDVIRSDSPLIVDDATSNPQFAMSESVVMYNILSILCVPLRTRERLIGTVYLDHRSLPALFSLEDVDFLRAFASLIATAIEKSELYVKAHEEIFQLKETLHQYYEYPHIVGKSAKMQEIFNLVEKVADSKTSVLILGESGTGKELIAHLIHERSQRKDGPFIRVNCAALAESILESELFGIEEKAATGVAFRKGKFELADGGTIFLDEIGDMSLSVQAKVLRVLQEKEFERVGGQRSIKVDIRIVSATNQDLQKKVQENAFRTDLFYRLNPIVVTIPPLRERKEDIPLLTRYFVKKYAEENKKPQVKITRNIMSAMLIHSWRGSNVRELQHFIERATLLSENGNLPQHLMEELNVEKESADFDKPGKLQEVLDWVEKKRILRALERNRWNQVRAAAELGLNETTLRRRMQKHSIRKPPKI